MEEKRSQTPKEIAEYFGISVKTLLRRLKPYKSYFESGKRKKIYFPDEITFIKSILKDNKSQ